MALALIGAGFGGTGTESMKLALEQLGPGRCHHVKEVLPDPAQLEFWRKAAMGETADWDEIFEGFGCSIDWPAAFFWCELAAHCLEAKILLTVRSSDSWYNSFSNTILKVLQSGETAVGIGPKLIGERIFGDRAGDRDHAIAVYERNTADVQAAFPPERLLTCYIGDGWEPLCAFLGKPAPDTPFPRTNSAEQFHETVAKLKKTGGG